jgi:hypothetical protein
MGIFSNVKTDDLEKAEDRVGGYAPLTADAYKAKITLAFAGESSGGARNLTIHADLNGREYRETIYVTSKKGDNFWLNDNNKKVPLPGYTTVNNICLVTTDKPLDEQDSEEKIVKLYDYEERKEMPKSVHVLTELIGKELHLGILNTLENKRVQSGDKWVDGPDEQNVNNIDAVFHDPTLMTVNEATSENPQAMFYQSWVDRNRGKVRDKRTIKDGQAGTAGRPGAASAPSAGASSGGERTSLFAKK